MVTKNRFSPYDQAVLDDPAYETKPGPVSGFISDVVYGALTPEQELLQQIDQSKQLRSEATAKALQGTKFESFAGQSDLPSYVIQSPGIKERLDEAGFKFEPFQEGFGRVGQFIFGGQRKAFKKLSEGEKLTPDDINEIAFAPLDALDFIFPPLVIRRLARLGIKSVDDAIKSTIKDPDVDLVKERIGGGSGIPLGIGGTDNFLGRGDRIALSPDRNGTGGGPGIKVDLRKDPEKVKQIKATKIKKEQEELFEPYRQNLQDYLAQTNVPSAKGFYNYLLDNKIPLTLEKLNVPGKSIRYKPPQLRRNKNISTETEHLKKAVDYLTDGKSPLGDFRPEWTGIAEKILEASDKKLTNTQLYGKLIEAGVTEAEIGGQNQKQKLQRIQQFTKKDYLSDAAKKNVVIGNLDRDMVNVENLKKDLVVFRDKLLADPTLQGKGIAGYEKIQGRDLKGILGDYVNNDVVTGRRAEKYGDIIEPEFIEEIKNLVKVPLAESREEGFRQFIPVATKVETTKPGLEGSAAYPTALQKLADAYRTNFKFIDPKTGETTFDFSNLESFEETAKAYGIERVTTGTDGAKKIRAENQEPILKLARDIEILQNKSGAFTKAQIQGYYDTINDSKKLSNYTNQRFREVIENNPELKEQLIKEYKEYYTKFPKTEIVKNKQGKKVERKIPIEEMTLDDFINAANRTFDGHVSHIFTIADFPSAGKGLEGVGDISNFVRNNFGVENLALQKRAENAVEAAIKDIKVGLALGEDITSGINTLSYFDDLLTRKGMALYRRIDKDKMPPEVINRINQELKKRAAGTIADRTKDGKPIPDDIAEKFNDIFLGSEQPLTLEQNIARFDELMDYYVKNPKALVVSKSSIPQRKDLFIEGFEETPYFKRGFIDTSRVNIERDTRFNKGGISMVRGGVQMAIGGQNFTENMNRQDFTPDPAIDGDSAFQQAVQSGNLQALNLPKIFKGLGEAFGVFTPKKVGKPLTGEMSAVSPVAKSDFPLQSFTLEKINNLNIQSARPQDWINELQGGAPAPKSELLDSGLFQYLADFEKYFPNQKVSKDKLVEFLENNPISNLKIKIKGSETGDSAYDSYMGSPRHKNVGSARMDKAGEDYREVIIEAGTLPGQQTGDEFVNSSHFQEKNVLAFGRVGTYKNSAGDNVAVIQEMQTDYLTQVRKEQELLNAEIEKLNLQKTKAEQRLERAESPYDIQRANESLAEVNSKLPALLRLQESKLIKPYPNVAAADKIPEFNKQLQDLQKQINNLSMQGVRRENPEFLMQISNLEEQQKQVLNQLLDLNRANEYEMLAKDVKVPDVSDRGELERYISGDGYSSMKNVKTFPPTPLNNQADYVDAILKAVIKDAENRGINKIAIMPADVGANARWSKESEDAKKKFRNLYDKVGVQQLKNIAKKYGGSVQEEFVVDSTKGSLGLRFLNKDVDGNFQVLKETDIDPSVTIRREDLGPSKPPEGLNAFLNEEILRVAKDYGPNEVVFRREIAPGQTMEYFVNVKQGDVVDQKFDLVPLGDADRAENATIVIEEYNPQLVKMNVLVLPDSNKDKPMYLFKKKKGGIMPDDRLVSITDIYGDY